MEELSSPICEMSFENYMSLDIAAAPHAQRIKQDTAWLN